MSSFLESIAQGGTAEIVLGHEALDIFICEGLAGSFFFFGLVAAWVKSRAERPSVSGVNRQLHVQIGCKLGIRNRKDELTKQAM